MINKPEIKKDVMTALGFKVHLSFIWRVLDRLFKIDQLIVKDLEKHFLRNFKI